MRCKKCARRIWILFLFPFAPRFFFLALFSLFICERRESSRDSRSNQGRMRNGDFIPSLKSHEILYAGLASPAPGYFAKIIAPLSLYCVFRVALAQAKCLVYVCVCTCGWEIESRINFFVSQLKLLGWGMDWFCATGIRASICGCRGKNCYEFIWIDEFFAGAFLCACQSTSCYGALRMDIKKGCVVIFDAIRYINLYRYLLDAIIYSFEFHGISCWKYVCSFFYIRKYNKVMDTVTTNKL